MKKIIALAAAALFLIVGALKLNAQENWHCYGFLTSCGVEFCIEVPCEWDENFRIAYLDFLEDTFCTDEEIDIELE